MNLYFLSFGVSAKPGIAKDLIEADDIARKVVADFIDSLLVENLSFTTPVVMDATMGTGTFKPEKNLEFFRLKSPGTHRWLSW